VIRSVVVVVVLAGCGAAPTSIAPAPPSTVPATTTTTAPTDERFNPAVTQATIGQTICAAHWTDKVRPPTSYTDPIKRRDIAGLPPRFPRSLSAYELDHWVPLELGGAPRDPANLVIELRVKAGGRAETKDGEEDGLHRQVCAGRLSLDVARAEILADWPASAFP
jgi:hypothetical protein